MTTFDQSILAVIIVYVLVSPYLAAWVALRLCRRNYDCPLRRENAAAKWTRQLEQERGQ
jgi:site-specific recombinase